MEDIHPPSVAGTASTAVAAPSTRNEDDPTESLFELMAEKDRVEEELKALGAVLDSVGRNPSLRRRRRPPPPPYVCTSLL